MKTSKNKSTAKAAGSDGVKQDTPTKSPKKKKQVGKSNSSSPTPSAANTPPKNNNSGGGKDKDGAAIVADAGKKKEKLAAKAAAAAKKDKDEAAEQGQARQTQHPEPTEAEDNANKDKDKAAKEHHPRPDNKSPAANVAAAALDEEKAAAELQQARRTQDDHAADAAASATAAQKENDKATEKNRARLAQNAEKDKVRDAEIERLRKARQNENEHDEVEVVDTTPKKNGQGPRTFFQHSMAATPEVSNIMAEADFRKNKDGSGDDYLPAPPHRSKMLKPTEGHSPNKGPRTPPGFQMPPFVSNFVYYPSRVRGAPGPSTRRQENEGRNPYDFQGDSRLPPSIPEPAGPSRPHAKPLSRIIRERKV